MNKSAISELYFIGAMMFLLLILSISATYLFFRQYKREMRDKDKINERARKQAEAQKNYAAEKETSGSK